LQEKDVATAALAKMNMILHDNATAEIKKVRARFQTRSFWTKTAGCRHLISPLLIRRFHSKHGQPDSLFKKGLLPTRMIALRIMACRQNKNGDYAFLLHIIRSLKPNKGKGAVILPHGVLFRGNVEAEIRTNIIQGTVGCRNKSAGC